MELNKLADEKLSTSLEETEEEYALSQQKKPKKQSKIDKNEIEYLRKELKKVTKKNKTLAKTQKVAFERALNTALSIEAPYVHVKITKILGGKGKKGEISLSAGGSIEKINTDDIEAFSEVMLQKMNEKIDYALQELQTEETE